MTKTRTLGWRWIWVASLLSGCLVPELKKSGPEADGGASHVGGTTAKGGGAAAGGLRSSGGRTGEGGGAGPSAGAAALTGGASGGGAPGTGGTIGSGGTSAGRGATAGGRSGNGGTGGGNPNGGAGGLDRAGGTTSSGGQVTAGMTGLVGGSPGGESGGWTGAGGTGPSGGTLGTGGIEVSAVGGGSAGGLAAVGGTGTSDSGGTLAMGGGETGGGETGGTETGGAETGGVETGGAATGGTGTGGTPAHKFVGGPCMVVDGTSAASVVYARGDDGKVYQNSYSTGAPGAWQLVTGLDASTIAANSDLDCGGYPITHIVAIGTMPLGSVQHASGTGTSFSLFANSYVPNVVSTPMAPNSPSVYGGTNGAANDLGTYTVVLTNGPATGVMTSYTFYSIVNAGIATRGPNMTKSLVSGTDVTTTGASQVAFADDGSLAWTVESYNMGIPSWSTQYYAPPPGTSFQYSPSVCPPVVTVAGDRLWWTNGGSWVQVSTTPVASAPDCAPSTANYGQQWKVVALTPAGTVLHVIADNGIYTETDLGTY